MSTLLFKAWSRCSQSTAVNLLLDHLSLVQEVIYFRATSLLAWNQWWGDMSPVILVPQIIRVTSSLGSNWVEWPWEPLVITIITACLAIVLHMQLSF
jgi:hypothetical protein